MRLQNPASDTVPDYQEGKQHKGMLHMVSNNSKLQGCLLRPTMI